MPYRQTLAGSIFHSIRAQHNTSYLSRVSPLNPPIGYERKYL